MRTGAVAFATGACVVALALSYLATDVRAEPRSTGNNQDNCTELDERHEPSGSSIAERVAAARLACRMPTNLSAAKAKRLLGANSLALTVKGDDVVFLARGDVRAASAAGTITAPLDRVGPGLWALRMRVANTDRALLQFFATDDSTGQKLPGTDGAQWQGPNAERLPVPKPEIAGKIERRKLWSDALKETRKINVYLPPGYDPAKRYPALYMGDGHFLASYAKYIEPMIDRGVIPPIVMVGAEPGQMGIVEDRSSLGVDLRAADYLPGYESAGDRFAQHMRFFAEELVPYAEKEFALERARNRRAIQGQSNSAAFAMWAAHEHPELFATALVFSMSWKLPTQAPTVGDRAAFVFTAGQYEAPFFVQTKRAAKSFRERGYRVVEEYPFAGHDPNAWSMLLVKHLPRAFVEQ